MVKRPDSVIRGLPIPYVNNTTAILITLIINLAATSFFYLGMELDSRTILVDSVYCTVLTSIIDVFLVYFILRAKKTRGWIPEKAPINQWIMLLPINPLMLSMVFAIAFGLFTLCGIYFLLEFYQVVTLRFPQMLAFKLIYSLILSAKIVEYAIFRYIQPDSADRFRRPVGDARTDQSSGQDLKNPLPRVEYFKNLFNSVTTDFGTNLLIGLLLGGTVIKGTAVIIAPTHITATPIAGCVTGIIITLSVVPSIAQGILSARYSGEIQGVPDVNLWLGWLPSNRWLLSLLLAVPIAIITALTFWSVMTFFNFETLNFFQFFLIRSLYSSILVPQLAKLVCIRFIQPDIAISTPQSVALA
jgi:hypothetical protein